LCKIELAELLLLIGITDKFVLLAVIFLTGY